MSKEPCERDLFRLAAEQSRELSEEEALHITQCPCCRKILEGEAIDIAYYLRKCLCHETIAPATLRTRIVKSLSVYTQSVGMRISYEEQHYREDSSQG